MEYYYNYPPNYYSRYSNETLDTKAKTSKLTELETDDELSGLKNDGTIIYTVVLKELKQGAYIGLYHVKGKTVHYTLKALANEFADVKSIIIERLDKKGGKIRRNTSSKKLKKRTTLKRRKTKSRK